MIVWAVKEVTHEGSDLVHLYSTKALAEKAANRFNEASGEYSGVVYIVRPEPVIEEMEGET